MVARFDALKRDKKGLVWIGRTQTIDDALELVLKHRAKHWVFGCDYVILNSQTGEKNHCERLRRKPEPPSESK